MYPHRIRLRGPWECEPLGVEHHPAEAALRPVKMPCRWADLGLGEDAARVRCHRRFGLPRLVDPHERIWLVLERARPVVEVVLNDHALDCADGAWDGIEFEVTPLLLRRNHMQVVAERPAGDGPLWDEVALEIRCTAFLCAVRIWAQKAGENAILHAAGEVAGEAALPLEVYVLAAGRTAGYASVTPGKPFQVDCDPLREDQVAGGVRVELVCGAVVWHVVERVVDDC